MLSKSVLKREISQRIGQLEQKILREGISLASPLATKLAHIRSEWRNGNMDQALRELKELEDAKA